MRHIEYNLFRIGFSFECRFNVGVMKFLRDNRTLMQRLSKPTRSDLRNESGT